MSGDTNSEIMLFLTALCISIFLKAYHNGVIGTNYK